MRVAFLVGGAALLAMVMTAAPAMADEADHGGTELNSVGMLVGGSITTALGVGGSF